MFRNIKCISIKLEQETTKYGKVGLQSKFQHFLTDGKHQSMSRDCFEFLLLLVIRSASDVLRAQSKFVKFVGGEAAGRTPYTFYKPTSGPKYVRNRPYNEFITSTTFI